MMINITRNTILTQLSHILFILCFRRVSTPRCQKKRKNQEVLRLKHSALRFEYLWSSPKNQALQIARA